MLSSKSTDRRILTLDDCPLLAPRRVEHVLGKQYESSPRCRMLCDEVQFEGEGMEVLFCAPV